MHDLGHEQVVFCNDSSNGLKAIIAIHNTVLGPGMGGTRYWNYSSEEAALTDVLRLSRGMTFKNAIAGINAGGGKAVIIGDSQNKSEAQLRRFGQFIDSLAGRYVTAEDVGMNTTDMEYIAMETPHVTGLPEVNGGGGDPSPVTAYGVYMGMKAAAKHTYGTDALIGKKVYVQGVGNVGSHLVKILVKEGCQVMVSDVDASKALRVAKSNSAEVVNPLTLDLDMDIYAPCALGATLNSNSIPKLKCQIIAGGANNQLEDEVIHAQMLKEKNIVYMPDFLINSGGIINVYLEYSGNYDRELAYQKAEDIYSICGTLLKNVDLDSTTTHQAAMQMARNRIDAIQ